MGQVIQFPAREAEAVASHVKKAAAVNRPDGRKTAELLFFTGVRYERQMSLPSQRIRRPVPRV